MIYLHKILPAIFSPITFVIILIVIGTFYKSKKINIFGILILIFFSLPFLSNKLINYLENEYEPKNINNLRKADAIVVLSGMVKTIYNDEEYKYEINSQFDRFIAGIDLFESNKAPILVFTNGKVPWSIGIPEGEYLKKLAIKFGISESSIVLTKNVKNTEQEAEAIKELFPNEDISLILVTSAYHMPRALKVFQAYNLNVISFPVDFKRNYQKFTILDLIPSAGSLANSSHFIKEMIGRLYYELKY